jgi:hypothetical protein
MIRLAYTASVQYSACKNDGNGFKNMPLIQNEYFISLDAHGHLRL